MSQSIDPARGSGEPITVERTVDRKDEGVTVTYHLAATGRDAVGVRIVQPLAGKQAVRDVGFHPDHEPVAWTQSDEAVVFDAVASPNGESEVVLGVAGDRDRVLSTDTDSRVAALKTGVDADADDFLFGDPFPEQSWFGGVRRVLLGSDDDENAANIEITDRGTADDADGDATSVDDESANEESGITIQAAEPGSDEPLQWEDLQPAVEPIEDDGESDDIVVSEADPEDASEAEADSDEIVIESAEDESPESVAADTTAATEEAAEIDTDAAAELDVDEHIETVEERTGDADFEDAEGDGEAADASEADAADVDDPVELGLDDEDGTVEDVAEMDGTSTEDAEDAAVTADTTEAVDVASDESSETAVDADAIDVGGDAESDVDDAESDVHSVESEQAQADEVGETSADEPVTAEHLDDAVMARLAAEIEAGDVDEESLAVLRERLRSGENAVDVRLRHVQSRMSDFEAYVDALEGVIEEHGTASHFMDETESQLESLDDSITRIEDRVDEGTTAHEALSDDVSAVEGGLEDLTSSVETLRDEVSEMRSSHETRFRRLEDDVDMLATDVREMREDLETEVDTLDEEVESMRAFRENLSAAFSTPSTDGDGA